MDPDASSVLPLAPAAAPPGLRLDMEAVAVLTERQRADLFVALIRERVFEIRASGDEPGIVVMTLSRDTAQRLALNARSSISWAMTVPGLP